MALHPRTSASASNTGMPASANIAATVDLPMPIEPVSAILIMALKLPHQLPRHRSGAAASCPNNKLEAVGGLLDQHGEAVDRRQAALARPTSSGVGRVA